jgi:hypothetical protein
MDELNVDEIVSLSSNVTREDLYSDALCFRLTWAVAIYRPSPAIRIWGCKGKGDESDDVAQTYKYISRSELISIPTPQKTSILCEARDPYGWRLVYSCTPVATLLDIFYTIIQA